MARGRRLSPRELLGYGTVIALLGAAWWLRPEADRRLDPLTVARDGVRPVVLPLLWSQRATIRATGDRLEYAIRLRDIARLVPSWVDGEIVAAAAAADSAPPGATPEVRWRLLATGIGWLQEARRERGDGKGAQELLYAMATMLTAAMEFQPELRDHAKVALGQAPEDLALAWLEDAARLRPTGPSLNQVRYMRPVVLLAKIRDGDLSGAAAAWEAAMVSLRQSPDPEAARWITALTEVGQVLRGGDTLQLAPATRARWLEDSFLREFAEAIAPEPTPSTGPSIGPSTGPATGPR